MESLQKRLQIIDYFDALVNKLDLAVENYYVNRRLSSARSPKIELVRAECIHELNEMKHKCLQTGDFVCSCIFLETKSTGHDMFDGVLLIFEDSPLDALISLTDIERGYCSNKWFTENDLCVISSRENQAVIRWEFCNTKLTSPLIKTTNAEFFSGGDLIIHMFSDNKRNLPPVITKKGLEFFTKYRLKEASFFADINLFVNFNTLFDYKNLDIVLATLNLVKSCASSVAEETAIFFEIFVANADPQLKILFFRLINSYELSNLTRAWFTWRFRRSLLKLPTDQFASAKYLKERITGKRPSIIQFDGKRPSHACKVIKNRGICRHLPFGFVRASSIVELAITIDESNLERFQSVCWKSLKRLHLLQDYDKEEEMHRQPPLPVGPRMFNKMPTLDTLIITHSADFQCFPQYNSQYSHPFEHISKTLRNLSILSNYPYKTDIDFCCAPIFADLPNDTSITCEFETNTYYDPVEDIGRYDNVLCYIKNITISENSYKYTVLCADYSVLSSPAQLNRCVANKIIYPFYSKHSRNTPLSLIWTSALRDLEEVKIQGTFFACDYGFWEYMYFLLCRFLPSLVGM